jgi:hypothetical protein
VGRGGAERDGVGALTTYTNTSHYRPSESVCESDFGDFLSNFTPEKTAAKQKSKKYCFLKNAAFLRLLSLRLRRPQINANYF